MTPMSAGPLLARSADTRLALAPATLAIRNAITAVRPHGTNVIKTVPISTPTPLANSHKRVPSPTASRRVAESAADQPRTPIPAHISQLAAAVASPPIQARTDQPSGAAFAGGRIARGRSPRAGFARSVISPAARRDVRSEGIALSCSLSPRTRMGETRQPQVKSPRDCRHSM
jgi:hypothetical protein